MRTYGGYSVSCSVLIEVDECGEFENSEFKSESERKRTSERKREKMSEIPATEENVEIKAVEAKQGNTISEQS